MTESTNITPTLPTEQATMIPRKLIATGAAIVMAAGAFGAAKSGSGENTETLSTPGVAAQIAPEVQASQPLVKAEQKPTVIVKRESVAPAMQLAKPSVESQPLNVVVEEVVQDEDNSSEAEQPISMPAPVPKQPSFQIPAEEMPADEVVETPTPDPSTEATPTATASPEPTPTATPETNSPQADIETARSIFKDPNSTKMVLNGTVKIYSGKDDTTSTFNKPFMSINSETGGITLGAMREGVPDKLYLFHMGHFSTLPVFCEDSETAIPLLHATGEIHARIDETNASYGEFFDDNGIEFGKELKDNFLKPGSACHLEYQDSGKDKEPVLVPGEPRKGGGDPDGGGKG
jgi:hypothetical protein